MPVGFFFYEMLLNFFKFEIPQVLKQKQFVYLFYIPYGIEKNKTDAALSLHYATPPILFEAL